MKRREHLTELRNLSTSELATAVKKAEQKLLDLRFAASFRKLKATSDLGKTRREIAQLQTILHEKLAVSGEPANQ